MENKKIVLILLFVVMIFSLVTIIITQSQDIRSRASVTKYRKSTASKKSTPVPTLKDGGHSPIIDTLNSATGLSCTKICSNIKTNDPAKEFYNCVSVNSFEVNGQGKMMKLYGGKCSQLPADCSTPTRIFTKGRNCPDQTYCHCVPTKYKP